MSETGRKGGLDLSAKNLPASDSGDRDTRRERGPAMSVENQLAAVSGDSDTRREGGYASRKELHWQLHSKQKRGDTTCNAAQPQDVLI